MDWTISLSEAVQHQFIESVIATVRDPAKRNYIKIWYPHRWMKHGPQQQFFLLSNINFLLQTLFGGGDRSKFVHEGKLGRNLYNNRSPWGYTALDTNSVKLYINIIKIGII